jgi:hypothetical protein
VIGVVTGAWVFIVGARGTIVDEETHIAEVEKMIRKPGVI